MDWASMFVYSPATGILSWKATKPIRGCVGGREAGTAAHHGYRAVSVNYKKYYVHRIAWEICNGPIPPGLCIDHIDRNCSNNKLENLRLTSLSGNQRNRRRDGRNPNGIHGVHGKAGGFAVVCLNRYIGYSKDFFEACCMRKSAELKNGYLIKGQA